MNRAERRRKAKSTPVVPGPTASDVARLQSGAPSGPHWGVYVTPSLWVSSYRGGPPSRWHRWWQRILLGWVWGQR